jgi:hypothetical protein
VLWALGELEYSAPPGWLARVSGHVHSQLWRFQGRALAASLWGLARCGLRPDAGWMDSLLDASISKLRGLDGAGLVMVAQALASFGYRPESAPAFAKWARWWETFCFAAEARSFTGGQVRGRQRGAAGREGFWGSDRQGAGRRGTPACGSRRHRRTPAALLPPSSPLLLPSRSPPQNTNPPRCATCSSRQHPCRCR